MSNEARLRFAARLEEVCDLLQIPRGHGRQAGLGRAFRVSAKAARKWLVGDGYPEIALAVQICERAKVNLNWLLQGVGPKSVDTIIDEDRLRLVEALDAMPREQRTGVLEFIRYSIERTPGWFVEEQRATYFRSLAALSAQPDGEDASTRQPPDGKQSR